MTTPPALGIVLDYTDPDGLAPFWGAALGYAVINSDENYVMLLPESRSGPKLLLQRVNEHKAAKNRMHLDIEPPMLMVRSDALKRSVRIRLKRGPDANMEVGG